MSTEPPVPLRVLLVEDSQDSELLLLHALAKGGFAPSLLRVETEREMRRGLAQDSWDVVISDFKLPTFDGLRALEVLKDTGLDLPFVIVSGTIGEQRAVQLMRAGAHDYVMKDNLARLPPVIFRELTEARHRRARREAEAALHHQARHDALTGLLNRYEFEHRLQALIKVAESGAATHVLGYLDLDQFKVINDTCGHVAGDRLLREIAERMRQHIRGADVLGRLGGDEFGLLLQGCGIEQAKRIAAQIIEAVQRFHFVWEGKTFPVGVSVGLVVIDRDSQGADRLMLAADSACYFAKQRGGGHYQVYRASDAELSRRRNEMDWVSRLRRALEQERYCLYQQPIRSLRDDSVRHYELLVRMRDEDGSLILPGQFIGAAERYNLMSMVDRWVAKETFRWLRANAEQARGWTFGINLSGQSLSDDRFLAFLREETGALRDLAPCAGFEITETAAISNMGRVAGFIKDMRNLGCRFFLDDFGSGLASFAYLRTLPVDFLKVDGHLIQNLLSDPLDCAIVEAVQHVGRAAGVATVVEWVSSEPILDKLREIGVDYAQGYAVGVPAPLEDLLGA